MSFDAEPHFEALVHAMDASTWTPRHDADGVIVHSGFPVYAPGGAPHPAEGFLIRGQATATLGQGFDYFKDACRFASTANAMTTFDEVIEVHRDEPADFVAVVRTGFALPWPLQNREFLHWVAARRREGEVLVVYATAEEAGLPPAWDGYLRCPMAPSGQRLVDLGDGRIRAEHCMTYDLVGRVPTWAQNHLFHRGHVKAYAEEWRAAMAALSTR